MFILCSFGVCVFVLIVFFIDISLFARSVAWLFAHHKFVRNKQSIFDMLWWNHVIWRRIIFELFWARRRTWFVSDRTYTSIWFNELTHFIVMWFKHGHMIFECCKCIYVHSTKRIYCLKRTKLSRFGYASAQQSTQYTCICAANDWKINRHKSYAMKVETLIPLAKVKYINQQPFKMWTKNSTFWSQSTESVWRRTLYLYNTWISI